MWVICASHVLPLAMSFDFYTSFFVLKCMGLEMMAAVIRLFTFVYTRFQRGTAARHSPQLGVTLLRCCVMRELSYVSDD